MAEKMISIFDPSANAFREVTLEVAQKFVDSSKAVEKKLAALAGKK